MSRSTAVLDIGSSKIICLICSSDGDGTLLVRGAGICEYKGYKNGKLLDEQSFSDAVVDSLKMAETEAKLHIRDISVGVPAPFTRLAVNETELTLEKRTKRVTSAVVDELMSKSTENGMPEDCDLMHSTPVSFTLDGIVRQDVPLGVSAQHVSATVSHVLVNRHFKRLVSDALIRAELEADMYIGVPLSEGLFVIPPQERQESAVLIDVGGTHTDVMHLRNSALVSCTTIDVGGWHFTNDLSYGLKIAQPVAENIKRRYVYSLDYQDSIDTVRLPTGGVIRVDHEVIQYIIEARSRELADMILQVMQDMGVPEGSPVYLTGGGIALMRGSCEYLERCMGIPIQVRMPWMPRLSSPNYASAYSVMDFVMHACDETNAGRLEGITAYAKFLKKLKDQLFRHQH